jgi:hypothetical protein
MVYFQTQNSNLGKFWMALHRTKNVGIFYAHLEYIMAIWYILWSFGIFYGHLVILW